MALLIGDNFNYQGQKPNFERDSFDTLESMVSYPETSIDDGHISYCKETKKHYIFNSSNESTDTGKWREFSAGVLKNLSEASDAFNTIYAEAQRGTEGTINDYSNLINQLTEDSYLYYSASPSGYRIIYFTKYIGDSRQLRIEDFNAQSSLRTSDRSVWLVDIDSTGNYTRTSTGVTGAYVSSSKANRLVFAKEDSTFSTIDLLKEGTGNKYLADNGQYKTIDASNSSAILPFEKAPQIVQRFVNDYLSDISRESYTIDYADQLFTDTSDINYVTYLYYNNTFGVTYIYFSGNTDSANRVGAVLDMPAYSGYHRLVSFVSTDNSGNVQAYYVAQTSQPSINGLSIVSANSEKSEQIDLYTNGSGTQFLSDDGTYKTITSSDSVIKSFSNAPQVIKNIINKIFEVLANSENTQFPVVIDYYNDLSTAIGNKTLCYIIDNFNDVHLEGYNNMTPVYLYLWNISGQIWINMYTSCAYLPNTTMQQYTIVVGVSGITQIHSGGHQIDGMNGGIFISTNFSSVGTDVNQTYEEQLTFAINGDGTKYLGDDGKYHEVKQVSSYGTTTNRPSNVSIGFQYFDTDLNRPIWWNGTEWVGATDANIVKLTQAQYEELTTKDPDTIYFIKG